MIIYEEKEISINMTFKELMIYANTDNFLEVVKVLRTKYHYTITGISKLTGINAVSIRVALHHGTITNNIKEVKVEQGIMRLHEIFLKSEAI